MSFLEKVRMALCRAGVRYALAGGCAVALHGAVRGTIDVDVVSRLPVAAREVFAFRDKYVTNRNLVAWSFCNPDDPLEQVDVIRTCDLEGRRTRRGNLPSGPLQVLSVKDLTGMKRVSGRPQDIEDVRALERLYGTRATPAGDSPTRTSSAAVSWPPKTSFAFWRISANSATARQPESARAAAGGVQGQGAAARGAVSNANQERHASMAGGGVNAKAPYSSRLRPGPR